MNASHLIQTLIESFNALADEVQNLSDRQTILEHKLRYAHEQFQYLADKHAPAATEISETLVNLQVPPELHNPSLANTSFVPLPKRKASDSKHQIAVIIREGRRVASSLTDFSKSSRSSRSREDSVPPTAVTSMSAILEQDFTVQGKKSSLDCPFSQPGELPQQNASRQGDLNPSQPHPPELVCAALDDETSSHAAAKCPIRYLDQHSPEEIAEYLAKHKHELPRSHEVCVRRYQKNEEHIRKLDAKYGNLVNMVEGLSRIHQPMLPEQDTRPQSDVERSSNQRVENWAKIVGGTETDDPDRTATEHENDDREREGHFDRPLKEVRVGESPSRPWGISVPVFSDSHGSTHERPASPPPAPVHMPAPVQAVGTPAKKTGKCPFDHTKLAQAMNGPKPMDNGGKSSVKPDGVPTSGHAFTPRQPPQGHTSYPTPQPAFLDNATPSHPTQAGTPQMLFTGPVFIGYPVEQAMQLMNHFQSRQ
ncbi:hypothetical protein GGR56DRAFT_621746 [Xylariaceae sp. FL0804]|nr:hypothetical protein GGR56DRAFT_621746 [Xylariaceae sp. FL0804]